MVMLSGMLMVSVSSFIGDIHQIGSLGEVPMHSEVRFINNIAVNFAFELHFNSYTREHIILRVM